MPLSGCSAVHGLNPNFEKSLNSSLGLTNKEIVTFFYNLQCISKLQKTIQTLKYYNANEQDLITLKCN